MIAGTNFDRATNLHPHLTDFAHEIRIRRMWILAGSITSCLVIFLFGKNAYVAMSVSQDVTSAECSLEDHH